MNNASKSKKSSWKKSARNLPTMAKPENYFILVTGMPLKNLKELAHSLEIMNEWVFAHHVNDSRNDFANWIRDILDEKELSEEIRATRKIQDFEIRLLRHLVNKYL